MEARGVDEVVDVNPFILVVDPTEIDLGGGAPAGPEPVGDGPERLPYEVRIREPRRDGGQQRRPWLVLGQELLADPVERRIYGGHRASGGRFQELELVGDVGAERGTEFRL